MKFDARNLKLPFYPGDSIFWIDEDEMVVKEEKNGIDSVCLTKDEIFFTDHDSDQMQSPDSGHYTFLTREAAEKALEEMKHKYPILEYSGAFGKWYDPKKYLPKDRERVIVTDIDGHVKECRFFSRCGSENPGPAFVCFRTYPRKTKVKSWMPLPEAD